MFFCLKFFFLFNFTLVFISRLIGSSKQLELNVKWMFCFQCNFVFWNRICVRVCIRFQFQSRFVWIWYFTYGVVVICVFVSVYGMTCKCECDIKQQKQTTDTLGVCVCMVNKKQTCCKENGGRRSEVFVSLLFYFGIERYNSIFFFHFFYCLFYF